MVVMDGGSHAETSAAAEIVPMPSVAGGDQDRMSALACELDTVYLQALDRMESQTRDAMLIDKTLRQLLDQRESDESILNWDPARAISPRLAFRSLALRLIHESTRVKTRQVDVNRQDYEDLLAWSDAPKRRHGKPVEDFLDCIEHGRTKRLSEFWQSLRSRISPDADPVQARINATADLLGAFSVQLPTEHIVPFIPINRDQTIVPYQIGRDEADLEWVITQTALDDISRVNHAISTLCQLAGHDLYSTLILEMNMSFHQRMRSSFNRYRPQESFPAGGVVSMRLHRDNVDFRFSGEIFELVLAALSPIRGLHFVQSHTTQG